MKKIVLFTFAVLSWGAGERIATADDTTSQLIPETGQFDDPRTDWEYHALLRKHFASRPHQWAQMVILPSNRAEETISIEGPSIGSSQLVHCKAKQSIWLSYAAVRSYEGKPYEGDVHEAASKIAIPTERHVAVLDEALRTRIVRAWIAFLRSVHYGAFSTRRDDDGTTYHFTGFILHYGVVAGKTWDPSPASLSGRFVAIGMLLAELADAPTAARTALQQKIDHALREVEPLLGL